MEKVEKWKRMKIHVSIQISEIDNRKIRKQKMSLKNCKIKETREEKKDFYQYLLFQQLGRNEVDSNKKLLSFQGSSLE